MAKNEKRTSKTMLRDGETFALDAIAATSTVYRPDNQALQAKYNEMHAKGPGSWFDSGEIERQLILKMGEPWKGRIVTEIGCGEGDLCAMMAKVAAHVAGVDYSDDAIEKAKVKHPGIIFKRCDYMRFKDFCNTLVMQGVIEHLDNPFEELKWMIDHFNPRTVITSSPGFLNPRGLVWMTLNMLGAVMSKTDLHYLNPWDFKAFCKEHGYKLTMDSCDTGWAFGTKMIDDLRQRIPLALKDGGIPYLQRDLDKFLDWLSLAGGEIPSWKLNGATICYRIDI